MATAISLDLAPAIAQDEPASCVGECGDNDGSNQVDAAPIIAHRLVLARALVRQGSELVEFWMVRHSSSNASRLSAWHERANDFGQEESNLSYLTRGVWYVNTEDADYYSLQAYTARLHVLGEAAQAASAGCSSVIPSFLRIARLANGAYHFTDDDSGTTISDDPTSGDFANAVARLNQCKTHKAS